jgi:spermidine synthase
MASFAVSSPWIILWAGTHLLTLAAWCISALSILIVGFFAGTEFPLLALIAEKQTQEDSSFIFSNLMSVDYLGMGLSSVLFPIFLLRHIGIFNASLLAAALNMILSFGIYQKHQEEFQSQKHQLAFLILFVLCALLIFAAWVNIDPITEVAQSWMIE